MTCKWNGLARARVLPGRHEPDCTGGEQCRGCQPCEESHCCVCSRNHADVTCPECLASSRDDLHVIAQLCDALPAETIHRGVNSEAAMLWGPTADPEAWRNRAMSAMVGRLDKRDAHGEVIVVNSGYLEDCRDEKHPLFVLGTWEQVWRDHLDQPTDLAATLPRLVAYLDRQLHVMAQAEEPPFDDFARDLRQCRAHLEDVLHDQQAEDKTRVPCLDCGTLLVKVYGKDHDDDRHVCGRCRRRYTEGEFALAKANHLASEDAERFVLVADALSAIARPEQTLRTWMRTGKVGFERDESGRMTVWWPDVRAMHLDAATRRRK